MRVLSLSVLSLSLALSACDAPEPAAPAQGPKLTAIEVIKPVEGVDEAARAPAASRPPSFKEPEQEPKMPSK